MMTGRMNSVRYFKYWMVMAITSTAVSVWLFYTNISNAGNLIYKSVVNFQKPTDCVQESHISRSKAPIRNVLEYEPWPEKQYAYNKPGKMYPVVHYVWCGEKKFRFHDYLSVLSAIRMVRPLKLVFHYTHMPQTDSYNTWFQELKATFAGLELLQFSSNSSCGSTDMAKTALKFLSQEGGLLLSESVILSGIPEDFSKTKKIGATIFNNSGKKSLGFGYIHDDFIKSTVSSNIDDLVSIQNSPISNCVSVNAYNKFSNNSYCILITKTMYPRDIIETQTPFGELARWIFYGRRSVAVPRQDPNNLIPRITHYILLKSRDAMYQEFPFSHFLSVLSALYVAGFEQVYVHAEEKPVGQWWEALAGENVTLVKVSRSNFVFGWKVQDIKHSSDILRYLLVYKYGGAYQDTDVVWTSWIPNSLLAFPTVVGMDWAIGNVEWPDTFNMGVFLARPQSDFLERFIDTHKDFRDNNFGYNSLQISYKSYELYPHLMFLDRRLQVLCYFHICHPSWEKGYVRQLNDVRPTIPFKWQEVRSIHVTQPKPHPSFASVQDLKNRKGNFAEIGRHILEKSGRQNLLR